MDKEEQNYECVDQGFVYESNTTKAQYILLTRCFSQSQTWLFSWHLLQSMSGPKQEAGRTPHVEL